MEKVTSLIRCQASTIQNGFEKEFPRRTRYKCSQVILRESSRLNLGSSQRSKRNRIRQNEFCEGTNEQFVANGRTPR